MEVFNDLSNTIEFEIYNPSYDKYTNLSSLKQYIYNNKFKEVTITNSSNFFINFVSINYVKHNFMSESEEVNKLFFQVLRFFIKFNSNILFTMPDFFIEEFINTDVNNLRGTDVLYGSLTAYIYDTRVDLIRQLIEKDNFNVNVFSEMVDINPKICNIFYENYYLDTKFSVDFLTNDNLRLNYSSDRMIFIFLKNRYMLEQYNLYKTFTLSKFPKKHFECIIFTTIKGRKFSDIPDITPELKSILLELEDRFKYKFFTYIIQVDNPADILVVQAMNILEANPDYAYKLINGTRPIDIVKNDLIKRRMLIVIEMITNAKRIKEIKKELIAREVEEFKRTNPRQVKPRFIRHTRPDQPEQPEPELELKQSSDNYKIINNVVPNGPLNNNYIVHCENGDEFLDKVTINGLNFNLTENSLPLELGVKIVYNLDTNPNEKITELISNDYIPTNTFIHIIFFNKCIGPKDNLNYNYCYGFLRYHVTIKYKINGITNKIHYGMDNTNDNIKSWGIFNNEFFVLKKNEKNFELEDKNDEKIFIILLKFIKKIYYDIPNNIFIKRTTVSGDLEIPIKDQNIITNCIKSKFEFDNILNTIRDDPDAMRLFTQLPSYAIYNSFGKKKIKVKIKPLTEINKIIKYILKIC